MGLDMYLKRTKKVKGLTPDQYFEVSEKISDINKYNLKHTDYERLTGYPGTNALKEVTHQVGRSFQWFTIFEEVTYWRKANHIHGWFVDNVQNGEDECEPHFVSKYELENLLFDINEVLADHSKAEELIPTTSGFFFGGTNYDDWYFEELERTKVMIEEVLKETDFNTEVLIYISSW